MYSCKKGMLNIVQFKKGLTWLNPSHTIIEFFFVWQSNHDLWYFFETLCHGSVIKKKFLRLKFYTMSKNCTGENMTVMFWEILLFLLSRYTRWCKKEKNTERGNEIGNEFYLQHAKILNSCRREVLLYVTTDFLSLFIQNDHRLPICKFSITNVI